MAENDADEIGDDEEALMEITAGDGVAEEIEDEGVEIEVDSGNSPSRQVVYSQINPEEWAKEHKRVGADLKKPVVEGKKHWSQHVDDMCTACKTISGNLDFSETGLREIAREITEDLESIRSKEGSLGGKCEERLKSLEQAKRQAAQSKEEYTERSNCVEALAGSLSEISEQLDELKDSIGEHAGKMEDSSPMVRLRQGLQKTKKENNELSMRLGVAKQLLVSKQHACRLRQGVMRPSRKRPVVEDGELP